MKILCVSDYVDPLVYNQNVKETFSDVDLILCAGDLPMDYIDFIVTMLNKPTFFIFGNHNLKEFHFYHSDSRVSPENLTKHHSDVSCSHGASYLGFRTTALQELKIKNPKNGKLRPLLLAGVSGSIKYNNGLNQYTDFQMKLKLIKMIPQLLLNKIRYGTYLDIFMTHASPLHIHDHDDPCHRGFDCYNWFLKKFKPQYMVHGHIHLYDMREERIGIYFDTTVVNAYAHVLIELAQE